MSLLCVPVYFFYSAITFNQHQFLSSLSGGQHKHACQGSDRPDLLCKLDFGGVFSPYILPQVLDIFSFLEIYIFSSPERISPKIMKITENKLLSKSSWWQTLCLFLHILLWKRGFFHAGVKNTSLLLCVCAHIWIAIMRTSSGMSSRIFPRC